MRGGSDDEEEEGSQAGCSIGSVTAPAGEEAGMRRIRWFCLRGKSLGRSFEKKSRGSTSFEREIDGECCVQEGLQKLKQYSTIMEVDDEQKFWEDSNVKKCGELMGVDMLILDRKKWKSLWGKRLALEKNEWGMMQEVLVHQMASSLAKD
ncbi:hypothetical protein Bca52824_018093 [Brassica carinata]|uniref:Uncharacterized protein n=1 Tax=Brassica carinata TaxID=52824 RepID=A0A8X7VP43_BRACI|nr:hypothetical protein Bca52824_018093 [Brassica carinata]